MIYQAIFNHQNSTPLNCLIDKERNLVTYPDAIANIIYSTQK